MFLKAKGDLQGSREASASQEERLSDFTSLGIVTLAIRSTRNWDVCGPALGPAVHQLLETGTLA